MRCRHPLALTLISTVAALLVTGCGATSGAPGIASLPSSTSAQATGQPGLAAYSHCMRAHGVATFPDPDSSGGIPKRLAVAAATRNVRAFKAAGTACNRLLPNESFAPPESAQQQRARVADGLSFASCMRRRGVSGFPDPTAQGELSVALVQAHGIDVHSPQVLRVVQRCLPASHGALTAAKVRQAIAEAGR